MVSNYRDLFLIHTHVHHGLALTLFHILFTLRHNWTTSLWQSKVRRNTHWGFNSFCLEPALVISIRISLAGVSHVVKPSISAWVWSSQRALHLGRNTVNAHWAVVVIFKSCPQKVTLSLGLLSSFASTEKTTICVFVRWLSWDQIKRLNASFEISRESGLWRTHSGKSRHRRHSLLAQRLAPCSPPRYGATPATGPFNASLPHESIG